MKIEVLEKVTFNLVENIGHNKKKLPYILTIWVEDNEIVIWLSQVEYNQLKKTVE